MPNFTLTDVAAALKEIGRGVVFQQTPFWPGGVDIALTHLGDTEGDIQIAMNESFVNLTTPELTGQASHKAYLEGANPVVTIPLFVADPALRLILSPVASKHGGYARRRPVTYRTLVIFPEELFYDETDKAYEQLVLTGDTWTVGGTALTARQTALLGQSIWFWKGYFNTPPITLKHADAGKAVEQVTFQVVYDANKPDGQRLWSIGDPNPTIDLDVA